MGKNWIKQKKKTTTTTTMGNEKNIYNKKEKRKKELKQFNIQLNNTGSVPPHLILLPLFYLSLSPALSSSPPRGLISPFFHPQPDPSNPYSSLISSPVPLHSASRHNLPLLPPSSPHHFPFLPSPFPLPQTFIPPAPSSWIPLLSLHLPHLPPS